MEPICRASLPFAFLAVLVSPLAAQQGGGDEVRARRTCTVGHVDATLAPVVDGDLDDPCWHDAPAIGDLVMVEPRAGERPTQPTVVKLLHDRHNLYLAIWCFDDDPASIRATQRERDARLDPDDRVEILLDTFENRRTGYFFQVGPGGSIGDGLASHNGGRFDKPWDVLFDGTGRVTARGWQAELAIPFRSLPRRQGAANWGFDLRRIKRSNGEESQWANASQSVPFFRISELGTLTGIGEVDDGIGLDVVPYAAAAVRRDRTAAERDAEFEPDGGVDLFYRLSPELTLAATAFTDFAETEDDGRQINLGRFPLFFPEKRDFFLEGAGYFAFGAPSQNGPEVLPFFSRRMGLDRAGNVVPVLAGLKLTGEVGALEVGALTVETDPSGGRSYDDLAVLRLRYGLAEQTAIGMIGTAGNPEGTGDNRTGGVDLYHRVARFVGDLDLQIYASVLGSQSTGAGDGHAANVTATSRGREWELTAGARWVSDDFAPALGFVRRTGIRQYTLAPQWSPRLDGGFWRSLAVEGFARWTQPFGGGHTDELEYGFDLLGIQSHQGDRAGVSVRHRYERIAEAFTLFAGTTTIAAGEYRSTRTGFECSTSDGRPLSGEAHVSVGDFFGGRSTEVAVAAVVRTNPLVHFGVEHDSTIVTLGPGQDFTTQIGELRCDLFPSERVSLHTLVQFDNESRVLGWQSRLRWIRAPGNDFFAVLGAAWQRDDGGSLVPTQQDLTLKLQQTLRF